jgi:hypothetical protein
MAQTADRAIAHPSAGPRHERTHHGEFMKTIVVLWDVPVTREDGRALPRDEIADTEVLLAPVAADGSTGSFVSLAKIKPDGEQTIKRDVPDGNYKLRFIVTDTYGQKGKAQDAAATVTSAPPGQVLNIKVTVE